MALDLKFSISEDLINGEKFHFEDVTGAHDPDTNPGGYGGGGNPSESDIQVTRIIAGDWVKRDEAKEITTEGNLKQWREYERDNSNVSAILNSGSAPYARDSTESAQSPFVLVHDPSNTDLSGAITETGRDLVRKDYVPADGALEIKPEDMNINGSVFPDRVYDIEYEVYVDLGSSFAQASAGNIVEGERYIVIPDDPTDNTILLQLSNNDRFFRYQVFQAPVSESISPTNATVYEMNAKVFKYFTLKYNSRGYYSDLFAEFAKKGCEWEDRYKVEAMKLQQDYWALEFSVSPTCLPNISGSMDLINSIENRYNYLKKCLDL